MKTLLTPVRRAALSLILAASLIGFTAQPAQARAIPGDILCFLFLGSGCVGLGAWCDDEIGIDAFCDAVFEYCIELAVDVCFN